MLEESAESVDRRWLRVITALGLAAEATTADSYGYAQAHGFDQITGCILQARENARQVREQISSEMWEQLNRVFLEVKRDEHARCVGRPAAGVSDHGKGKARTCFKG